MSKWYKWQQAAEAKQRKLQFIAGLFYSEACVQPAVGEV